MDKYAIYLRKSRADEEAEKLGEGETLARHKKILTELAARKGLYVEKIYSEIVSGETIADRPEIKKLISDCYDGKYKGIIVVDVDRLSRGNQADMQTIMDMLKFANKRQGLLVITPTKTYDVAHNYDDEEYIEFVLFMSRREYKTILKRMQRGKLSAVAEGNYIASARPYGYDILKTRTGRTLQINEEEAKIVKDIYDMRVNQNMSMPAIAKKLTMLGVPTYTGIEGWSADSVVHILKNPVYIGKVRWNTRMTIKKMEDGKLVKTRPNAEETDHYMLHDGKHKAIISDELFQQAQNRFYSDKTKVEYTLRNPLAGILVCKKCGRVMYYRGKASGFKEPRFAHQGCTTCHIASVRESDLLNAFNHAILAYIGDFETKVDNLPLVDENTIQGQIEAIEKEIRKAERKLSKLFDSWEDELITNNEFVERKQKHNDKISALKKQIEELESAIPEKEAYEEKIMFLSDALEALKDDNLPADIKNQYLKRIIEKIEFSRPEGNESFELDIYLKA